MKDPLAGQREAMNNGKGSSAFLPDPKGKSPCPVEIGQLFKLRSCGIEITQKQRVRCEGKPCWRIDFIRIGRPSKPYLLKQGGGHTHDPDLAMRSQDEWQSAPTLDTVNPGDRTEAHRAQGEPPEPEGVPPEEVATLSKTMEARLRHREERREARVEQTARADAKRIGAHVRDVAVRAARLGLDATPFIAQIESQIKAQERELHRAA